MARSRPPHIVSCWSPDLAQAALGVLESGGLAALAEAGLGTMDVYVTFNDGSQYLYPDVNTPIALSVIAAPNGGAFESIKYWPGYRRVN